MLTDMSHILCTNNSKTILLFYYVSKDFTTSPTMKNVTLCYASMQTVLEDERFFEKNEHNSLDKTCVSDLVTFKMNANKNKRKTPVTHISQLHKKKRYSNDISRLDTAIINSDIPALHQYQDNKIKQEKNTNNKQVTRSLILYKVRCGLNTYTTYKRPRSTTSVILVVKFT